MVLFDLGVENYIKIVIYKDCFYYNTALGYVMYMIVTGISGTRVFLAQPISARCETFCKLC